MDENSRGKYIVIEGTDGAGTTTQKNLLGAYFRSREVDVVEIAEPGGTPIGNALRQIIKDESLERSPDSNFSLFTVCRSELARQIIKPAIHAGKYVISDRNWFSTVAYQGFGEGLDTDLIIENTQKTLGEFFIPDISVIIDVPVEVSQQRILHRGTGAGDYFEQKGPEFFAGVRQGYLWVADRFDIPVIDGTKGIEEVHAEIAGLIGGVTVSNVVGS